MKVIAIYLPTYKRPNALATVARNIELTTKHPFTLYFGLEKDDELGIGAANATGHKVVINKYEPGYSNTVQTMYEASNEPYWIHANDDFEFLVDWDVIPLSMFDSDWVQVVGLRQTESDNHGSAICMARRSYIEKMSGVVDQPNRVFHTYHHNYIDTEFTATAQSRGVWAKCDKQVIRHNHPGFTGGPKDETYKKNDVTVGDDEKTFNSRKHLWQGP